MEAKFPEIKGDASLGKMLAAARGLDFLGLIVLKSTFLNLSVWYNLGPI